MQLPHHVIQSVKCRVLSCWTHSRSHRKLEVYRYPAWSVLHAGQGTCEAIVLQLIRRLPLVLTVLVSHSAYTLSHSVTR